MYIAMRPRRMFVTTVLVVGAAAAGAQTRPDFSGEWVLNRQESVLPPPVSDVESGVVRIEHREPSFIFQRRYVIAGTPREAHFAVRTDGAEVTETSPQGFPTAFTLRWDDSALVLAMRIKGPKFEATNDVRYELLNDGHRLRATEQGRSPQGGTHNAVWVYDRR
jgi:hypothetical protein